MRLQRQQGADQVTLTAGGRLTVSHAARLRAALIEALDSCARVELVLEDVEEADLSLLQLLCAARRSAAARGIAFAARGLGQSPPLLQLLRSGGAERAVADLAP